MLVPSREVFACSHSLWSSCGKPTVKWTQLVTLSFKNNEEDVFKSPPPDTDFFISVTSLLEPLQFSVLPDQTALPTPTCTHKPMNHGDLCTADVLTTVPELWEYRVEV